MINDRLFFNLCIYAAPPRFSAVTASASVLIQKGESGTLDCSAVGVPVPTYSWIVPPAASYPYVGVSSTLTINAVDFTISGIYTCVATNSLGAVNRSFDVFVFGE